MTKVRRALVSVSEKRGLVELARTLVKLGVQILSTGGTAKALAEAGIPVVQVSAHTGAPEILEGRVKTLHPRIHGGLLGRPIPSHEAEMAEHDILPIDLVVVNLYPFRETVAKPGVAFADAVENIDIGGPSMLRSAAKNHERVGVVVDPADYAAIAAELEQHGGALTPGTRFRLAAKAFAHTAAYDAAIASFLSSLALGDDGVPKAQVERRPFPDVLAPQWHLARALRYGENPHQHAAFYGDLPAAPAGVASLATADVLQGKELSYNNLLDLDAALGCVLEFPQPAAVIVKHTNPCGVAVDERGVAAAYRKARETDPVSAFGGIVAVNRPVGEELAKELEQTFLECVIAPAFDEAARQILARKKNLRLVATGEVKADPTGWALRSVAGGILVQSRDARIVSAAEAKVVTKRQPTAAELAGLDFAWRVGKHVKSNAIIFVRDGQTVGVGAGQMSRIDSVKIAVSKAQLPVAGTVASSDAFFPFRDGLDAIAAAGATAIIQPGGSVKDEEVIAAADEHGMAMLFTAMRHFRH